MRRAVPGLEQQAILAAYEHSEVLCNFRMQIDVAVCGIGLQIGDDEGFLTMNLLSHLNRAPVVGKMLWFRSPPPPKFAFRMKQAKHIVLVHRLRFLAQVG